MSIGELSSLLGSLPGMYVSANSIELLQENAESFEQIAGAGRPMDRDGGVENAHDAPVAECTRVTARFPHRLGRQERRPHAPQARSLYSSNRDHVASELHRTYAGLDGVKACILRFLESCPESRDLLTFEGPSPRQRRADADGPPTLVVRPGAPGAPRRRAGVLCLAAFWPPPGGTGKTSLAHSSMRILLSQPPDDPAGYARVVVVQLAAD